MTSKLFLRLTCGIMVLVSLIAVASMKQIDSQTIVLFSHETDIKTAAFVYILYYMLCLVLFVKSYYTKDDN